MAVKILMGVIVVLAIFASATAIYTNMKKSGIPWSGPHFATYEMSNGHLYYTYPIDDTSLFLYDADNRQGYYYYAERGNEGPFVSSANGFRWVLQWHGDTISVERVPNNVGVQPDYFLNGNKIPNDYHTRSYKGLFTLTNRNEGGPAISGQTPPGFMGTIEIQPTGKDFWVAGLQGNKNTPNGTILFQKELDNGYGAYTYSATLDNGVIMKIIFYDHVNFQMLIGALDGRIIPINGTRDYYLMA